MGIRLMNARVNSAKSSASSGSRYLQLLSKCLSHRSNSLGFSFSFLSFITTTMNHNSLSSDPSTRNPRIHRETGIPSISRPRTCTTGGISESSTSRIGHAMTSIGRAGPFGSLKKTAHHFLSKTSDVAVSHSRPRFATMPSHHQPFNTQIWADTCHGNSRNGMVTPPTVDFKNFESEQLGNPESPRRQRSVGKGMSPAKFPDSPPSVLVTGKKPGPLTGSILPASARKPDPRLILSSLESVLGAEHDIEKSLDAHELLAMHQLDQVDFEDRDRTRMNWTERGRLNTTRGRHTLSMPFLLIAFTIVINIGSCPR